MNKNSALRDSSEARYFNRQQKFIADKKEKYPRLKHNLLWILHNNIVHLLLGIIPCQYTVDLHDVTSAWLNKKSYVDFRSMHKIPNKRWWLFHNVISHSMIGLLPITKTFQLHDWSAHKMAVIGWE